MPAIIYEGIQVPVCIQQYRRLATGEAIRRVNFPPTHFAGVGKCRRICENFCRLATQQTASGREGPGFAGSGMAGIVVVFDFDRTLIDGDSDRWVVTQMGLSSLFNELRTTLPWNSLMDRMMMELHLQGKTAEDIAQCLSQTPLHPQIIGAIKSAHALGCEMRIVSDANLFFIEKILDHHGLLGCFSEIDTNPSELDEHGRLRISPYHDPSLPPHGCCLCPSNMCKGLIINQIRSSISDIQKKRFIYLGDGGGDFCPSLKLGEGDYVMPRKDYPLWKRIHSDPMLIKAEVHEWTDGEELAEILLHLIDTILTDGNTTRVNLAS